MYKRQLLGFSLTCGEGKRWSVDAAVSKIVPETLSRYRTSMPYSLWRRVCMQALHAMHGQLTCIAQQARDGRLHTHNASEKVWSPHGDWDAADGESDSADQTAQHAEPNACAPRTSTKAGEVATGATHVFVAPDSATSSRDTCSHHGGAAAVPRGHRTVVVASKKLGQEGAEALDQRPCGPGMCGAHGMHACEPTGESSLETGGGDRGARECSWEQLQEVVTATLRLIYRLIRQQVLQGDACEKGQHSPSSQVRF